MLIKLLNRFVSELKGMRTFLELDAFRSETFLVESVFQADKFSGLYVPTGGECYSTGIDIFLSESLDMKYAVYGIISFLMLASAFIDLSGLYCPGPGPEF